MSALTGVIERHFAFTIVFHTGLVDEVCQCRRVFVTPKKIQVRLARNLSEDERK